MRIAVLGAGAWGTAMAVQAAQRHEVVLWARDAQQALAMQSIRRNQRYLPDVPLPAALRLTDRLEDACALGAGGLILVATPMSGLRDALRAIDRQSTVLWLCKGLESDSGLLGHEVARQVRPDGPSGVLSGPSFALEVAQARPTALVVASTDAGVCERALQTLHGEHLRIYTSDDPTGVEVGGAVKNVMAIAAGMLDGLAAIGGLPHAPGLNARAALITRGLAEITRLGVGLGASADTFMGLSGLGDLVLTATGGLSRNRRVGLMLAQGQTLSQAVHALGHVAEGVHTAPTVLARARRLGVEMPITEAVVDVLEGRLTPVQAMHRLMSRDARAESA